MSKKEENQESVEVRLRWRDCFKFWLVGFIIALIILAIVMAIISYYLLKAYLSGQIGSSLTLLRMILIL